MERSMLTAVLMCPRLQDLIFTSSQDGRWPKNFYRKQALPISN